jgi:hypothetical protein
MEAENSWKPSGNVMGYFGLSALCAAVATTKQEEQIFLQPHQKTEFVHAAADPQLILAIQHVLLPYTFTPG